VGLRAGLDWCGKSHPHQEFYTCTVHKYRQVVVFNGTLDLMWAGGGGGSSESSVAFWGFRELKYVEKCEFKSVPFLEECT